MPSSLRLLARRLISFRHLTGRLLCVVGVFLVLAPTALLAQERLNFVVILCDDLGYGDLGCYGHPSIETPHLDALAESGVRFTDCYASAPVCSPSRAGLLTGIPPSLVGVYDWIPPRRPMHLRRAETTVAGLLRDAGYATCHVGKWHLNGFFNSDEHPQPDDHGFDYWFATQNNAAPSHEDPGNFVRNGTPVGPLTGFSCGLVADEAIRWLDEERPKDRPFFLFVCFHEPHEPIASPDDLVARYPEATERGEALYYANVTNMDRAAGRLVAALDERDLGDNTLVFFTSDNGPETLNRYRGAWRSHGSPGPLRGMKLHLYEGGIRVPGIVRFPRRLEGGRTESAPVSALDIFPTLCDLAGVTMPEDPRRRGTSWRPWLERGEFERERPLFWHYHRSIGLPKAAVRDGDWMLLGLWDGPALGPGGSLRPGDMAVIKQSSLTAFELYHLGRDLEQQMPVSREMEPEIFDRLQRELVEAYRTVQEQGHDWEADPDG